MVGSINRNPVVGDGVTISCGSDSYVGTVIEIKSSHRILVQEDAVVEDGHGHASSITRNENGAVMELILNKRGWAVLHNPLQHARIGERHYYYDLSF